jgi:hypothetical protein
MPAEIIAPPNGPSQLSRIRYNIKIPLVTYTESADKLLLAR